MPSRPEFAARKAARDRRSRPAGSAGDDHTTGDARAGIASRLGLVIVGVGMDDHAATNHPGHSTQAQAVDFARETCLATGAGDQVGHVATMSLAAGMMTIHLTGRVEVPLCRTGIGGAAVADLM